MTQVQQFSPVTNIGSHEYNQLVDKMYAWCTGHPAYLNDIYPRFKIICKLPGNEPYVLPMHELSHDEPSLYKYYELVWDPHIPEIALELAQFGALHMYLARALAMIPRSYGISPLLFDWFCQLYQGAQMPSWRSRESLDEHLSAAFDLREEMKVVMIDVQRRKVIWRSGREPIDRVALIGKVFRTLGYQSK